MNPTPEERVGQGARRIAEFVFRSTAGATTYLDEERMALLILPSLKAEIRAAVNAALEEAAQRLDHHVGGLMQQRDVKDAYRYAATTVRALKSP